MNIFSIITLIGGLAFFLYGMYVMSHGLEKMTGGKLEKALDTMTSSPLRGLVLGIGITVAIQSSSALTVMLVGLVNSGVMQFSHTVSVIMGSNIGTTLTAWLLSLVGINSDNILIQLLKPTSFSPILAFIGILMIYTSKRSSRKDLGSVFIGFSILMFGMSLMSDAMAPLADSPDFADILVMFKNPLLGVLVGAVFTGIIQSSAASVGILQALSLTGGISYGMAIPIIMGQNIGTCVTSLISSIGVSRNAKRVAVLHISFNIIGTVVCLIVFYSLNALLDFSFINTSIDALGIAFVHSVFNVLTTAMLFPFSKLLIRLATFLIPGDDKKEAFSFTIDERILGTPSFAIPECDKGATKMAILAEETLKSALSLITEYSKDVADKIYTSEDDLDKYEDRLGSYLVRLSSHNLTLSDSNKIAKLLHVIGDFERIGDHSVNLLEAAAEKHEKKIVFSDEAEHEIAVLKDALTKILETTIEAYITDDNELALKVEPLEETIDDLIFTIKTHHITRLQSGLCTIEFGFVLSDILSNIERVSDHCSNIALAVLEAGQNDYSTHAYSKALKSTVNEQFIEDYERYNREFKL